MKYRARALLVLCLMLALTLPAQAEGSTYTLMIYLCGTDLETDGNAASMDLMEMIDAELDVEGPVHVIVETGGTKTWAIDTIAGDKNERMIVGDDLYSLEINPRASMGDPNTLAEFVTYCATAFPADRYGLILWNHGGGSTTGVCFDEYDDDYLTTAEIHDALAQTAQEVSGFRLDMIAFDACLMATFEMANHVKDYADYMVASEELAPGYGFDYTAILSALKDDPAIETQVLGQLICDSFLEANLSADPDDYMTLSVMDLSGMDALTQALETLGEGLTQALDHGALPSIARGRQSMRSFGDYADASSDMVDLRQLIQHFAETAEVDADAATQALDAVVVYNQYTADKLDNISGMSILLPQKTRADYPDYREAYDALGLYPQYSEFVTAYTELSSGGQYTFASTTPQETTGWLMLGELGENVTISGSSQTFQNIVGRLDEEPATEPEAFGEDGIYTYSLTLTDEEMTYLSYVEGNLMIDISDEEIEAYVDLGYLQNAVIDWDNNSVYSLFDGTWPMLEGQFVHMTDQIITDRARRSLIDVTVNGEEVYLLVVFDEQRPDGEVIGYTQGYSDNGAPVRGYEVLTPGDVIIPNYYLYYYDEGEEIIEAFEGDEITYTGAPLSFGYESIAGGDIPCAYSFCLNDIFGEYQFTDFVFFTP